MSLDDIFTHGPWSSVKDLWQVIAMKLESKHELHALWDVERKYLVQALHQMCESGNANIAFGVTRKGIDPQYVKSVLYLVNDLNQQGMSLKDAWDTVSGLDLARNVIRQNEGGPALKRKITRAKRKFWPNCKDK